MSTYQKNIRFLKKSIFETLNNDSSLRDLLKGAGRIFHKNPPKDAVYPCIIYSIINDTDNPYNDLQSSGEVTRSNFRVEIFSNDSDTQQSDDIEARVKELLQGQRTLDSTEVICYSCIRDGLMEPIKDPDSQVWITPTRYRVTWATK